MYLSETVLTFLVYVCLITSCVSPVLLLYWLIKDIKGKSLW